MAEPDAQRRREYHDTLERLERFAVLTDTGLRIPGTNIRFGVDALIGLIPGIGDLAGMLISLWLYVEASRLDVSGHVKWRMLGNILIDTVGGLLPVAGDLFDVAWRANSRNVALLRAHLEKRLAPRPPAWQRLWPVWVGITGLVLLGLLFWSHGAG